MNCSCISFCCTLVSVIKPFAAYFTTRLATTNWRTCFHSPIEPDRSVLLVVFDFIRKDLLLGSLHVCIFVAQIGVLAVSIVTLILGLGLGLGLDLQRCQNQGTFTNSHTHKHANVSLQAQKLQTLIYNKYFLNKLHYFPIWLHRHDSGERMLTI